ncbi:alpha/beta hydrolase [Ectopseudomonas mendocina]|uniref:Alpha/beta hydrolase n=1 Tax=Ectopseudomonas mendocina TaxID=300 RepID=A0ABZ2RCY7_ECTME
MPTVTLQQHWIETARGKLFAQSWTPSSEQGAPIILLHDSLGCVTLWRDFPEQLAAATERRVIAYDRLGFGQSDVRGGEMPTTFVQDEATTDFNAVLNAFDIQRFVAFGHSVGGGMAVGCAVAYPNACEAVISESAQGFFEINTKNGITHAKNEFAKPGQMDRLAKYHGDKANWVLHAWTGTWLTEAFANWSLKDQLPNVHCPLLCLHGDQDEFGSNRQPEFICAGAGGPTQMVLLANCGHVPHREYPQQVLDAVRAFLR